MIQQYPLKTGWMMQSSQKLSCFGNTISRPSFQPHDWYPVSVPQTVVGGLFENKVIDDPFYDEVMKQMQGFKRSALSHFSFHHMPDSSPFRHSWWYRTEFCLSQKNEITNKRVWLRINGINNCANLWINSRRCAGNDYITGSFRWFFFDVTSFIDTDGMNALAVELFAPQPDDLCITFIDWNPVPPDDCMGIWQPISIEVTGPGIMKNPWVNSEVQLNDCLKADLCLQVDIENTTDKPMNGVLRGVLADRPFAQEVQLPQYSTSKLKLRCEDFSQFRMENPRLWWPYQLGEPFLYSVELNFEIDGVVSDTYQGTFGIRQVSSRINEHGSRLFTVNGIDLLIRGAAWSPDLLLRQSEQRDRIDIAFLKTMNLNALRFEGHFGSDHFWRLCDREGILVFAGWPCCTQWERWEYWKPGDYQIAEQSLRSQLYRLRNHPSLTCWLYGSDYPPPEPVERLYLSVLEQLYPQLPTLSSASAHAAAFSGRSGVKMSGPYTFVPPQYWYDPSKPGVAYGFNTETGPDVCIPVIDSLKKMFSSDHLKPGCDAWNHHAGLAAFRMTDLIQEAIEKRYGQPDDIEDFARVSQVLSYECWRSPFEAYGRNFPIGTGIIGWMMNSAWPKLIWQMYDYYLQPVGGFYGVQKACEPIHIQYSYDDASVWVLNNTLKTFGGGTAVVSVYTMSGLRVYHQTVAVHSLAPMQRLSIWGIPPRSSLQPLIGVYFVVLQLFERDASISRNVYWLPVQDDVFVEKNKEPFFWQVQQYADLSCLRSLKPAIVNSTVTVVDQDETDVSMRVTLQNSSENIAFFMWVHLRSRQTRELIAPVFWSENCLTLMPHEEVSVIGKVKDTSEEAGEYSVQVLGWNGECEVIL